MITSKQRAELRAMANELQSIFQIGKGDMNENFIEQIELTLEKRELIKISVLKTCERTPRELCDELCERVGAEAVQVIGNRFVIYKKSKDDPRIVI